MHTIKLEQFEGPLDLLLQLIEDRKLDITRLSLAEVADQYIAFLYSQDTTTLEHLADFLVVAARLLLIKSKAILPILEISQEEEEEIDDLEFRLAQYKRFKEISTQLRVLLENDRGTLARDAFRGFENLLVVEIRPAKVSVKDIHSSFLRVLDEIPNPEKLKEKVLKRVVSLEERIMQIRRITLERVKFRFSQLAETGLDKADIIVSFLALLELVRQRFVEVNQDAPLADIHVERVDTRSSEPQHNT